MKVIDYDNQIVKEVQFIDSTGNVVDVDSLLTEMLDFMEKTPDDQVKNILDPIAQQIEHSVLNYVDSIMMADRTITSKIATFFAGSVGFMLNQYIIENNITIKSFERELNEDEKLVLAQRNRLKDWSEQIVSIGNDPDKLEALTKGMIAQGRITKDDLEKLHISEILMDSLFGDEDNDDKEPSNN
jgi:6-pyruvoyl-tetrahydropterin synthase